MVEPPSDQQAERLTVGCILARPAAIISLIGRLTPADFFYPAYGAAFSAASHLAIEQKPISAATVGKAMPKVDYEAIGGHAGLAGLLEGASGDEAGYWADRVVAKARKRKLLDISERAANMATSDSDPTDDFSRLEALLLSDSQRGTTDGTIDMDQGVSLVLERLQRYVQAPGAIAGLPTGLGDLDVILDGLKPGCVTIVYGPTSNYKSALIGAIGYNLSSNGVPGLWFTTESPRHEVMERLLQLECRLNFRNIRREREMFRYLPTIQERAEYIRQYPIWVNDMSILDISFLNGAIARAKQQWGIEYVIIDLVDHVRHAKGKGGDTAEEEFISIHLKEMAKRYGVSIIGTAHINKPDRSTWNPKQPYIPLDRIKGASSKFQDADACLSLMVVEYEDGSYVPKTFERISEDNKFGNNHQLYLAVTKNRQGEQRHIVLEVLAEQGNLIVPYQ